MPKAHSPLRLEAKLVADAKLYGKPLHRSAAQQIEYWADIGKSIAKVISPMDLMEVYTGVAKVKIEPVISPAIDPDDLFNSLEDDRLSTSLMDGISNSPLKYQSSILYPGLLEQIDLDGSVAIGQFENGEFKVRVGIAS